MYRNKHPHGNMAVLVGATDFGQGVHATCDADMLLSEAVSLMTSRRMHRLVVTMKGHVAGVISLTDVVHKLIG
jgi:signal-transduction protein with cAMP-binding, CBS, and nucleotidyltransferase domain